MSPYKAQSSLLSILNYLHAGLFLSTEFVKNLTFFLQKILSGTHHIVPNSLDSDKGRHSMSPDLSSNCLQRLSADDKSPQGRKGLNVNMGYIDLLLNITLGMLQSSTD